MNEKNLLLLADRLEKVPAARWDYGRFRSEGANLATPWCGSVGCAIGHGCEVPELRAAGLDFDSPIVSARLVFGLKDNEAWYLFAYPDWHGYAHDYERDGCDPEHSPGCALSWKSTAADVAHHIREFVEHGGIPE